MMSDLGKIMRLITLALLLLAFMLIALVGLGAFCVFFGNYAQDSTLYKAAAAFMSLPYQVTIFSVLIALLGIVLAVLLALRFRTKEQLAQMTYMDSVTGFANYFAFRENALKYIKNGRKYAYVLFDISRFEAINTAYGFREGNLILRHIAKRINAFIGPDEELFARSSDDNFAMLLCYDCAEQLQARLQHLFENMNHYHPDSSNNCYTLNYACGIYLMENGGEQIDYCHESAQIARNRIKALYDTSINFYDDRLRQQVTETQIVEASMYDGLANNEFEVYIQPKYELKNETIVGGEALIRWHHPTMGFLMPSHFIPIFEQNGFLLKLDCCVNEQICRVLQTWIAARQKALPIAVNMSRLHVRQPDFVDRFEATVRRYDVPTGLIEVELTESAFLEDTQQIIDVMNRLREKGFCLSMDDFGTGYSSLNLLNVLPMDIIKLDRMMFIDLENDVRSKKVVTNAVHIVRDLDMKVVAEGIETREQVDFLKEIDCDMVQGYYFAKPMPVSEFEKLAYGRVINGDTFI